MESDHEELHLQKLREYVCDEDKIVTYSWLCNEMKLEANKCKELLKQFVDDRQTVKDYEIGVTYLLAGILAENSAITVLVCKDDEVEEKKKSFKTVSLEYVYSVQKTKTIDLSLVSLVDMFTTYANPEDKIILGSVIGKNCVKRNLKVKKALPVVNRAAPTDKSKASHLFTKASPPKKEVKKEPVKEKPKSEPVKVEKKTPSKAQNGQKSDNKKGSIANFFSKAPAPSKQPAAKLEEVKKEIKEEHVEKEKSDVVEVMDVDDEDEVVVVKPKSRTSTKFYDSDTDEEAQKVEEINKAKAIKEEKASAEKKKPTAKRARKDGSSERPKKKRKRIVERHASDSDDMFADEKGDDDEDSEATIVMSDDEPAPKKAVTVLAPKNKNKKWVDKTYTDDEGYLVTKREYISVSGSENDEEEDEKEQINPQIEKKPAEKPKKVEAPKKEVSPPVKGAKGKKTLTKPANQPTLMSFFKKK